MRRALRATWPVVRRFLVWTGFHQKHLVDYVQMFVVPIVVLLAGTFVSQTVNASAQRQAAEQAQDKRVQDYLSQMTTLVLDRNLLGQDTGGVASATVREVARAQTITALNGMDGPRKRFVVTFLYQQGLISGIDPLVALDNADLSGAALQNVELFEANLDSADLASADLTRARLTFARLDGTDLQRANLDDVLLVDARLDSTDLRLANLTDAEIANASMFHADLRGANLTRADLASANLLDADLRGANLANANLTDTNLTDALIDTGTEKGVTPTNLAGVTWSHTTCPDGTPSDAHGQTCVGHLTPQGGAPPK